MFCDLSTDMEWISSQLIDWMWRLMQLRAAKNLKEGLLLTQGTSGERKVGATQGGKACAKSIVRVGPFW